jgi:hypothetical protein
MPTYSKNRIVFSVRPGCVFPDAKKGIDSTISWNQGDILYFDDTNNLIKPIASDANGATVMGIAQQTIVNGKPVSPYQGTAVDAAQAIPALAGPQYGVVAKMLLKSGDSFNFGDLVYYGGDAQTVSSTGTNSIGIYQGAAVTASAGSEGEVLLINRLRVAAI